ncbi:restriction endonuclease subunit S [Ralstonia sp. 1138]|uniref:restriction endonuclease subunit S n=1 Tax=Ralstonia sp. 1138 TaxID=3156423 RepID=UPI003395F224
MELRSGYKQTEAGLIPEDWDVHLLGTLATMVASGRSSAGSALGDYPVYGSTGIIGNTALPEYDGEAILTARVGANAGRLNFVSGKYGVTDNTIILRFGGSCNLPFFWRQLEAKRLNSLVFGSGQPLITGTQLKALPLAVPAFPEQTAIAEALGDVDALLSGLDKLIAKKRDLKQAAMQQLLTGKTRLPGFSGEWEVKRLGEFGVCYRGVSYSPNDDLFSGDVAESVRLLRANNVQNSSVVLDVLQFVKRNRVADHQYLCVGDVLICMANGSKELVGKAARVVLDDGMNYTFGAFMGCYRPNTGLVNASFSFYLFQTEAYRRQLAILLAGSSINNLSPKSIDGLEMKIPARREEQASIAEVLSSMDAELAALEARREKTRLLKQGMMQELLTGKTRLV